MNLPFKRCSLCKHGLVSLEKCNLNLTYTKDSSTDCSSFIHWSSGQREPPLSLPYNPLLKLGVILGEKCKSGGIGKLA